MAVGFGRVLSGATFGSWLIVIGFNSPVVVDAVLPSPEISSRP